MTPSDILIERHLLAHHRAPTGVAHQQGPRPLPWLSLPLFFLAVSGLMIGWLSDGLLSREGYWQMQQVWFMQLNRDLSVLPTSFWSNLTELGDATVLAPLVALLTLRNRQVWMAILAAIPFAGLASALGKKLAAVPRPGAVLDPQQFEVVGSLLTAHNSLPSGHSITVFAGIVAWLVVRFPKPSHKSEYRVIGLGLLVTMLLAISRVAVGAHWPLDVLVGAGLGSLAGIIGASMALKGEWQGPNNHRGCFIASTLLGSFVAVLVYRALTETHVDLVVWLAMLSGVLVILHLLCENLISIKLTVQRHPAI